MNVTVVAARQNVKLRYVRRHEPEASSDFFPLGFKKTRTESRKEEENGEYHNWTLVCKEHPGTPDDYGIGNNRLENFLVKWEAHVESTCDESDVPSAGSIS
jgi:hypothetical protein